VQNECVKKLTIFFNFSIVFPYTLENHVLSVHDLLPKYDACKNNQSTPSRRKKMFTDKHVTVKSIHSSFGSESKIARIND